MPSSPDPDAISRLIAAFPGTDVQLNGADHFFIYDPERTFEGVQRIPFATLTTRDEYDRVSDLDREGIFRLNFGVSKDSYLAIMGEECPRPGADGLVPYAGDYTALDTFMPHPYYGPMHWICILNPGAVSFERIKPLLAEAHALARQRAEARAARSKP